MTKLLRNAVFSDHFPLSVDIAVAKYLLCYWTEQLLRLYTALPVRAHEHVVPVSNVVFELLLAVIIAPVAIPETHDPQSLHSLNTFQNTIFQGTFFTNIKIRQIFYII